MKYQSILSDIKQDYEIGYTIENISKKYSIGYNTVRRYVKKYGWIKKSKVLKYNLNDIKNDYVNGEQIDYICKKYHIHYLTLMKHVEEQCWKQNRIKKEYIPRTKDGYLEVNKDNLQKCINERMTYSEMEKVFGYKENMIRKYIKHYDVVRLPLCRHKDGFLELTRENLINYYITKNYRLEELESVFGFGISTYTRYIKKWNINKPKQLSNELRENKCLEKYGEKYPSLNTEVIMKKKQTILKKYGSTSFFASDIGKNSIKNSMLKKYGVENISQLGIDKNILKIVNNKEELIQYINDNNITSISQLADMLGYTHAWLVQKIHEYELDYLIDRSQSYPEKYIKDIVSKKVSIIGNDRQMLCGKEIDIFIPEKNIGIEFNGNFWHCERKVDKMYHQEKSLLAEEKGIFLYHIFEYEWNEKREKIINQLNNLLGLNENKIYARKCKINEVPLEEKVKFLNKNHMQGDDKSSVKLGLYYENELVSIMTFVKPRFNKNYQWELSRFCSKANCNVVGGASKLFKYFVKTYNPKSIISYSNNAHTRGNLYSYLGFVLNKITKPNYVWCKNGEVLTRYQCQKHKLLEQGFEGDSEADIMHNRGYYRIYDCGNKVWIWNNIT